LETIKVQLQVCYQCGACVSSCGPGLVNPEKNLRLMVRDLLAVKDTIPEAMTGQLWLCTTCYQCEDRCPEGIPLATLLIRLKNMAADRDRLPEAVRREIESVRSTGFTYRPLKGILTRRQKLGLPDLPRPDGREIEILINRALAGRQGSQPKGGSV
jgi:heterodisulfide reductase subunit C